MIQQPRPVKLRTIIALIKKRSTLLRIGAIFCIVAIGMSLVFMMVFPVLGKDSPKVDYPRINDLGEPGTGTITRIETQYNVTINNEHPSTISYQYAADGKSFESTFETLAPHEVRRMNVGDTIPIKYIHGESIITTLEPFSFPGTFFFAVPAIFLLMGLPCVLILIYRTRNEIRLMKFGTIADAQLISMTHNPGLLISEIRRGVEIHYQYKTSNNRTYMGEGVISDLSLLNTLKHGDTMKIFISPEDESKSMLVSHLEATRNNWRLDKKQLMPVDFDSFKDECLSERSSIQEAFLNLYDLNSYERWSFDEDFGVFQFDRTDGAVLYFKYSSTGSFSDNTNTWKWSWDNERLKDSERRGVEKVKAFGQEHQYVQLTTGLIDGDEYTGFEMNSIAAKILSAIGIYNFKQDYLTFFLVFTAELTKEEYDRLKETHVKCETHGAARAAFVCQHLNKDTYTGFHEAFESNPLIDPDDDYQAWCDVCEEVRQREGEWNEASQGFANIRLICDHCYFEIKRMNS